MKEYVPYSQEDEMWIEKQLYPMTMDVSGLRSWQEHLDAEASRFTSLYVGCRIDWDVMHWLVEYARKHHERLNK